MNPQLTAATRYSTLDSKRSGPLQRARACSSYTIPSLVPPEGHSQSQGFPRNYQSIGASLVNGLAAKLLLSLVPPTRKFFRLRIDDKVLADLKPEEKSAFEVALSNMEMRILERGERLALRPALSEALKHLIVAGNVCLNVTKSGVRVFGLQQYVARRDGEGNLMEIIIKERISPADLPSDFIRPTDPSKPSPSSEEDVDLYTWVRREGTGWKVSQECMGVTLPGTAATYPLDKLPYIALRWTRIDGEDYGRGHCEDHLGDLVTCETLQFSLIAWASIAAKIVWLVNPNGMTNPADLAKAPPGGFAYGVRSDLEALGIEKFADFQVANTVLSDVIKRLNYAYLATSSIQRDAERVTAEEIRLLASELENTLGGVYAVLSAELQLPLVGLIMALMVRENTLPSLPNNTISPSIVTGLDALGRNHELGRLDEYLMGIGQLLGPETLQMYVNTGEYLRRRASALDIAPEGLIRSDDEVDQMRQQAQQASLVQAAAPNAVKAAADVALARSQAPTQ